MKRVQFPVDPPGKGVLFESELDGDFPNGVFARSDFNIEIDLTDVLGLDLLTNVSLSVV